MSVTDEASPSLGACTANPIGAVPGGFAIARRDAAMQMSRSDIRGPRHPLTALSIGQARPLNYWPDALIDPDLFRREQERLSHVWTLLGFTHEVPQDGDWLRAPLATRSVFVQRFGGALRAFENRCAHRSFPLRNADRGNGPIVCDFHHWRYDKEGRAVAIPECMALFGKTPETMDARLTSVEIACCGEFIFGRFRKPGDNQTLEQFLGESFAILKTISSTPVAPQRLTRTVEANWRLCFHANVEDYHPPTIHPQTFGKAGYVKAERFRYFRFGWHSAFFHHPAPDGLTQMAAACRDGTWRSQNYRVFHIFPDLTVSHLRAHWENWYIVVVQYSPVTPGRSVLRTWFYPAPVPAKNPAAWYDRSSRWFSNWFRRRFTSHFVSWILRQDEIISEKLQEKAVRLSAVPILGALEERLAWFEEAYAEMMQGL